MTPEERAICVQNLRALAPGSEMPSVLKLAADELDHIDAAEQRATTAEAERDELRRDNKRLRKDSARLDWLLIHCVITQGPVFAPGASCLVSREEIDKAAEAAKEKTHESDERSARA